MIDKAAHIDSRPRKRPLRKLAAAILALGLGSGGYFCAKGLPEAGQVSLENQGKQPKKTSHINDQTRRRIFQLTDTFENLGIAMQDIKANQKELTAYEKRLVALLTRFAETGDLSEYQNFILGSWSYESEKKALRAIDQNNPTIMSKIIRQCFTVKLDWSRHSPCGNAIINTRLEDQELFKDAFEQSEDPYYREFAIRKVRDMPYIKAVVSYQASRSQTDSNGYDLVAAGDGIHANHDNFNTAAEQSFLLEIVVGSQNNTVREAALEHSTDISLLQQYAYRSDEECNPLPYQKDGDTPDDSEWRRRYDNDQLRYAARRQLRNLGLLTEEDFFKGTYREKK